MDYYYRNNQQHEEGPLPEEILREWLKLGQIRESTSVRRCDSSVWITAAAAFTQKSTPSALLGAAPVAPAEEAAGSIIGPKIRLIGTAAIGLLLFIAYQKGHRNGEAESPVASQPRQQPQTTAPFDASHQLVRTGLSHLYGIQCSVNMEAARQCFTTAASQNDCCGAYWQLVTADTDSNNAAVYEAVMNACASLGNGGDALAVLCVAIDWGWSSDRTYKQKGMELLQQMAQAGDSVASIEYGYCLMREENNREAQQQGFLILQDCSVHGMVRADRYLGLCYLHGIGTKKNEEKGKLLIKRAADYGDPEAIAMLKNS